MKTPVEIKGFKCYAPELAYHNEGESGWKF
jgi:hypothetical protein